MKFFTRESVYDKHSKPIYDVFTIILFAAFLILVGLEEQEVNSPLSELKSNPVTLDYNNLFVYSVYTSFRMFVAIICSTIFGVLYGLLAAKNPRLETILVPLLDVLQSVPVLGFISFTVTGFLNMFPGQRIGAELAVVFAIFTSQAWNIAFSVYSSIKTMPKDLIDLSESLRLNGWLKFWTVELPFATPGIIWNIIISMAGGWFFIVASEVIKVGNENIVLDGIGSYIALSLTEENTNATLMAVIVMSLIIILYDQLIMRPLVVWSDKFVYDMSGEVGIKNTSWALKFYSRSSICQGISFYLGLFISKIIYLKILTSPKSIYVSNLSGLQNNKFKYLEFIYNILFNLMLVFIFIYISIKLIGFIDAAVDLKEVLYVIMLATITWFKIMVLVILASLVWVPLGVYMGLNPKIAGIIQLLTQFLASFPINLLFPFVYIVITEYNLNPNIWLSPLMIVGTQWYILFNVVGAANSISLGLRDIVKLHKINGITWWKEYVMPAILPYYITGAITAYGASWNASIVSEVVNYGNYKVECLGVGAYISDMTNKGDFARIALGILVMATFVVIFNKLFWQKLYEYAAKKCNI